jgi:toxin-antitoxin system PIN domain toxin
LSFAIDVNLLVYASDAGSPHHERAAAFLAGAATGGEAFYLAWITLMGYLRIATHPAIFNHPLTHAEASANVEMLLESRHARVLHELDGFWPIYQSVCDALPVRGNLVPDAHLAALLKQHGVKTICTHDRDFRKFDFLTVRDPLA